MRLSASDVMDLASYRREFQHDRRRWDDLDAIYNGRHKDLFPKEFRKGEVQKIAGFIRRSWLLFARHVGKVPDLYVMPMTLEARETDRAEAIEKVCYSYNEAWAMPRKARVIAHYLTGFGAGAVGVVPNHGKKQPQLLVEDPRNVYPGASWDGTSGTGSSGSSTTGNTGASFYGAPYQPITDQGGTLRDCLIRKTITGQQLREWFPENQQVANLIPTSREMLQPFTVWQHFDDEHWQTILDGGITLESSTHGIGWCPWHFFSSYAPNGGGGGSAFEQQIGLEIAFMRLLDQKLALNDAITWPWLFTSGHVDVDEDRRHIRAGEPGVKVEMLHPPATHQADRDMGMLRDLLRMMNFESEATQGEVSGGPVTGRGLVELSRATVDTVQSFFGDLAFFLPHIYASALAMDLSLWPTTEKQMRGRARGETFFESYTPEKVIAPGFGLITAEYGPGLGGFEGHLQMLQSLGANVISEQTVMEKNPYILSVGTERRRIILQKLEGLMLEGALKGEMAVPVDWLAELAEQVATGKDWKRWIVDNPAPQATATPENMGPLPPEIAAALGAGGPPGGLPALPPGVAPAAAPGPAGPPPPGSVDELLRIA